MTSPAIHLVLASTSQYRKALLEKLGLAFIQLDPKYEEFSLPGERPAVCAARLALGKSRSAASLLSSDAPEDTIIIGSDQVAHVKQQTLSKPGGYEKAFNQLQLSSGNWVTFSTAVCLTNARGEVIDAFVEEYQLKFRLLTDAMIHRYLELEQPYDCAGSIKAEGYGIVLIEDSVGHDINTLYGLPLMRLVTSLLKIGVRLPGG